MIKLEVRQSQAPAPVMAAPIEIAHPAMPPALPLQQANLLSFSVLVAPPFAPIVLAPDAHWASALEKEAHLNAAMTNSLPLVVEGRRLYVTGATPYAGGRVLYQCVAMPVVS